MDGNFLEKIEKFKLPIALGILGIVLIIGGIFAPGLNKQKTKNFPKESLIEQIISVDVSGAVRKPGVYQLKGVLRIEDGIKAAGGFAENASQEYISKYLNMAQKLSDGMKIYIPFTGEQTDAAVAGANTQTKVNINSATQSELEALSGIGPVTASRIISDRPYQTVEELINKKIVSKAVFEKIKDLVVY